MGTFALSHLVHMIITAVSYAHGSKKDVLQRLLMFHRGFISDDEIIGIIDFYKGKTAVIESVLSSGALSEPVAYRMLQLFPRKKHYRDLVDKAYGHAPDTFEQSAQSLFPRHENMFDGKMIQAHT
jgi:hypothetical protein